MAKSRATKSKQHARFQKFLEQAQKKPGKTKRRRRYFGKTKRHAGIAPLHNPPLLSDLLGYAAPGLGGFVVTKFVANLASSQIAKRFPRFARHAGAIGSIGTFLGAWYFGHKIKFLERWHSPIVVGSAIASAHNLIQLYFPDKLAWIVGSPKQAAIEAVVKQAQAQQQIAQAQSDQANELPDHLEEISDDPAWYTFNDAYDAGRYKATTQAVPAPTQIDQQPLPSEMEDQDLAGGIFGSQSLEN